MTESRWQAVLFDLDGTLADTVPLILACYRHTMTAHLGAAPPDSAWLRGLGMPLSIQLLSFARDEAEAARMVETYVAYQRTAHDALAREFAGACDAVAELRRRGIRLGVVTSKRRDIAQRTIACCGLTLDAFDVAIYADDVELGKPDPEPVLLALERLDRLSPASVLMVGDSPHDIEAGRAAGVRTAAVLWGPFERAVLEAARPDYVVGSWAELLELCGAGGESESGSVRDESKSKG
ncbi:MAG: HAD-IA family hydrolase [Longimicrobiales bacterium]